MVKRLKMSFMSFTCPQASLDQFIGYAKQYGYDGIEPRAEEKHNHGIETKLSKTGRATIRKKIEQSGIACCCIATSRIYCYTDKTVVKDNYEKTLELIQLAHDIGCPRLRVFGGDVPEGMSMNDGIDIVAEGLKQVAPEAEKAGVTICLETHDSFMRADDCSAIVKKVNSPAVGITWDIMHPFTKGMTIDEAYGYVKGLVRHCHIHDGIYEEPGKKPKLALMGKGQIPNNRAVVLLSADNYDGYLSGEWINAWPPEEVLPHDIKVMHEYMNAAQSSQL
ncbi:MAG: sugar phosphate isomerase/epimerase [Elusimicrobia bacterium]|nr:sugar phosphate isomerase/epimerase [Elusimicrobiota bacterium]